MKDKVSIDPAPVDVGARFDSRDSARKAVERLAAERVTAPAQVEILARDGRMRAARGAESEATRQALVRWHVLLGAAGLLLGLLAGIFAWYSGFPWFHAMPVLMLVLFTVFGTVIGLLLGGLFSARPAKAWLAAAARDDARKGAYPVIVHATDHKQARRARELLADAGGNPYLRPGRG
jgi:hypothetical protein